MKKKLLSVLVLVFCCGLVCAYNPPSGGELLYLLATPQSLSNGASAAGGALPYATAEHTAINPALVAGEQRIVVNAGFTGLFGPEDDSGFGSAMHVGAVIPTKYGVFTGAVQGVFTDFQIFDLGNTMTIRGGFAKDISDSIHVGASLASSFGSGFGFFGDLGVLWNKGTIHKLPWLKDVRIGFALTELGLPVSNADAVALNTEKDISGYPGWVTPRAGIAGTLISAEKLKFGASADIATPSFQNILVDLGLQCLLFDTVRIKTGWEFNLRECIAGTAVYYPDVTVAVKIGFRSKDDSFLTEHGWQQSELVPAAGYRYLEDGVQAYSAELAAHLGLKDTEAPVIELWADEEGADE
ncbi:MAG: hypothetical protein KBT02_11280 [Treponema sp.]|nr:hypothetical protein [Candidatus Treponema caballi]